MAKRTVILRADGNADIGLGHFTRTLALAEMLNKDFQCVFATQKPTDYQICEIAKVCHHRIDLPLDKTHFNAFLAFLKGDEIIVLDNYYFSTGYQQAIKTKGCKLVCIDDMHDKHYCADVVINYISGITKDLFSKEPYTKLFLGSQYTLLRKEFLMETYSPSQKKFSFLLMMGGADPLNITDKILSIINFKCLTLPAAIVIGPCFQNKEHFNSISNIIVFREISSSVVCQLMADSVFGILPASTVAIEACAARLPFICGYYTENQIQFYEEMKNNRTACCIGDLSRIDRETLGNSIHSISRTEISNKIINRQKILIDKKSNERIITIFNEL
jgi:UDP-2,4-diacetamido-2,4,6-trideoxy-beta-L-altropyranose hydrolase